MENTSYEKFENLLNENNVTAYKVAKNTGLGFSFFTKWKQGKTTPKLVTLQKIADYFGVSVSYFTGELDNYNASICSFHRVSIGFTRLFLASILIYFKQIISAIGTILVLSLL